MMQHQQIRTVGKLAATLDFPLIDWLRKERFVERFSLRFFFAPFFDLL
jgi:hypothetical protein